MNRLVLCHLAFALGLFLVTAMPVVGDEAKGKVLAVTKETQKLEVTQSQIGYRDTMIFYTFADQKAVLKLNFKKAEKSFAVSGTVYLFADDTTAEGLKKWLNNQHSDGLFPEVPMPTSTVNLPEKQGKVTSEKMGERVKAPFGEYDQYAVEFSVEAFDNKKGVTLKSFQGNTKVFVKAN